MPSQTLPARQAARAPGSAQGHTAARPRDIPARGWWSILKRAAIEANEDRIMTEAAGVTFYALLSVFPALTALVSLFGLFADPAMVGQQLQQAEGFIPAGGMQIIDEQLRRLASGEPGSLGFSAVVGLGVALWSANQGTKAMFDALNIVYEEEEKRGFLRRTLITLAFTLGALVFTMLAMGAVVVLPVVLAFAGLESSTEWLLRLARWPLLILFITALLATLYRFGPSREKARWRWVSWGGVFAALAWAALSAGFSFYVGNFGNYDATYGSLGAVIGFMTWIWLSAMVVLFGAELNAEMEHQTARDTTTGPEQRMGQRGATMADSVAADGPGGRDRAAGAAARAAVMEGSRPAGGAAGTAAASDLHAADPLAPDTLAPGTPPGIAPR
ncbi:YihY/virulence factor BrkB family protein [Pseudoroseomonas cervicalis]|uniref:YihY/virulence factor BrkB family protein n=1 Tax=Teichococcus cervicalis TaxID=204525 RepID=UPI0022F1791C|nr:YihY/virulence factor BrkB family protein [Pseudoroseomonas cervicalis]WBV43047.1 YihY/virulence factor BrkB family protein [Pseudoroseomonas cervicalis]